MHDQLRAEIDAGGWAPGERLPSELALAARFEVNRLTVRHALAELARSGVVVTRQGAGTFVRDRPAPIPVELGASDWLAEQNRASRAMQEEGDVFSEKLLDLDVVEASGEVAEHLGAGRMLHIEALHLLNGEPVILSRYWTRSRLDLEEVRARAAADEFGPALLTEIVGSPMYYGWRSFDAIAASRRHASTLQVPVGAPLLQRCGLNVDARARPVLYLERDAPGGRMHIVMRNAPPAT